MCNGPFITNNSANFTATLQISHASFTKLSGTITQPDNLVNKQYVDDRIIETASETGIMIASFEV